MWPWERRGTVQKGLSGRGRYYVYRLRYPDSLDFGKNAGKPFYIGKGTGERLLAHERETRAILKSGQKMRLKHKHKVIIQIWDLGHDPIQDVVFRSDDEEEAYQVESGYIDDIGLEHLTNATYGRRPKNKRGGRGHAA